MRARFSFSYLCCCYLFALIVVSLFHLCMSNKSFNDDVLCIGSERQALLQFKHGLVDEAGRLASWVDSEESNCCKWVGIGCDNITGHVHRIHLPALNGHCEIPYIEYEEASKQRLRGKLSSSLLRLKQLSHLDLSCNYFEGIKVPKFIGSLTNLRYLNLSYSSFDGMIPPHLGNLSKLHILDLGSFQRQYETTSMMNMQWLSRLHLLQHLDLSGVDLSKSRPEFPLWLQLQKDLEFLSIRNTNIYSPMPPESFWSLLPNLTYLDMSQNHIQGTLTLLSVPAARLGVLDLSSNELTGKLTPISNFSFPIFLDLSNNIFDGSLHDLLCSDGVKETKALILRNNHFSDVIPECWDRWSSLNILNLDNNSFSGGIPTSLGFSSQLQSLNLRGNNLSGRLPASLMNLTNLVILQLGRNKLVGSIPSWFGTKLSLLRLLNLRSNKFVGNIPRELCYLKHIQILDLAQNNLSGNIPLCFNNFSVFTRTFLGQAAFLDLSSNYLVGHIPSELTSLKALQALNLSRNLLTGRIPEKIGDVKALISLDLSMNMLSGELPVSLSNLNFLSSFNVSYNNLTGRIPSSTQLQSFDESSFFGNNLCGPPLTKRCVHVGG